MLEAAVKVVLVAFGLLGAAAYLVLVERRFAAWVQDRLGPNRVGIPLTRIRLFGLGQPIADGMKFIFKEEFTPGHVNRVLYFVAPMVMLIAALGVFAVIPFGSVLPVELGGEGGGPIQLVVAPGMDVGLVFIFAISAIGVYGVLLGSWASNNKYSLLGGLRSAAQLISYEIPLGVAVLGVVLSSGSLRLERIIGMQAETGVWNVLVQPLGFFVFMVAAFAEAGRLPFDLPEAEQELVGGYHTEYSGMKLMIFLVSEFLHMVAASFLMVILFFGGWHLWGVTGSGEQIGWLTAILRVLVLVAKVTGFILFFMLVRWSLPRFRFDQLMRLCWKVMLPLGMVQLVLVAVWLEYGPEWAAGMGLPLDLGMALSGWAALVLGWLVVTWSAPVIGDNRPRPVATSVWEPEIEAP
ncbi:MAG TPA: NADH-quinone oxidoreductase subunit NuoH [Planctomycetaceae bacterium]|nr:NADH-quinone oxidoreductase subunit NuoH [Planctomycetaceae bacterium]